MLIFTLAFLAVLAVADVVIRLRTPRKPRMCQMEVL